MPTLLSLSMHFPGICVEEEPKFEEPLTVMPAPARPTQKRVRFCLIHRVYLIRDTEDGTVAIYSLS